MSIDLIRDELLTLGQATNLIPKRRGRKAHASTLWRWAVYGHHGVYLEAVRAPSGWFTTTKAVQEFLVDLARQERERCSSEARVEYARQDREERRRESNRVLERAGVDVEKLRKKWGGPAPD